MRRGGTSYATRWASPVRCGVDLLESGFERIWTALLTVLRTRVAGRGWPQAPAGGRTSPGLTLRQVDAPVGPQFPERIVRDLPRVPVGIVEQA